VSAGEARAPARLVIAGVSSGVGKTTVTCALALSLRRRGLSVVTFKCGPDYLDPTYHVRASGQPSHNLDGWMMGQHAVLETFARASRGHDLALIEGVMGLFDGADPSSDEGSSAQIAKWLDAPVLLVVDASGMARSLAALTHGFFAFDPALRFAGVLANRVGSRAHLELLRRALPEHIPLFGLPRQDQHAFPERHLGLRTADAAVPEASFEAWADTTSSWIDLDALLEATAAHVPLPVPLPVPSAPILTETRTETGKGTGKGKGTLPVCSTEFAPGCRIGIASDAAFHFYYDHNLALLEAAGAQLIHFSPCRDATLPDVDGLYFGGGYPELHARELSANHSLHEAIRQFAAAQRPIYAECGGLMYLCAAIHTSVAERFPMVGLFQAEARMARERKALGYVELETTRTTLLGPPGTRLRGHQFRYSELVGPQPADTAYRARLRRTGASFEEGYVTQRVLASYVHAHWGATPDVARAFVESCLAARS
jgi:cobyrinic acid a,c-diamide synthase